MSDTPALTVSGVCKRFGGRVALDGVNLSVARGTIAGCIGPNGSGKSTLFNIVAGTLRADSGSVSIMGRDTTRHSPAQICREGVGRTFQISRLFTEMTVLENLVAVAHGMSEQQAVTRAMQLLEWLEVGGLTQTWCSDLSYGQRKLVEIARALMLEPKLLLLDEPFAGINPRLQNRIVDHLTTLRQDGVTLFFIDHEMRIVLEVCDHLHVLAEGRVIAAGPPAMVRADPAVVDAYF